MKEKNQLDTELVKDAYPC